MDVCWVSWGFDCVQQVALVTQHFWKFLAASWAGLGVRSLGIPHNLTRVLRYLESLDSDLKNGIRQCNFLGRSWRDLGLASWPWTHFWGDVGEILRSWGMPSLKQRLITFRYMSFGVTLAKKILYSNYCGIVVEPGLLSAWSRIMYECILGWLHRKHVIMPCCLKFWQLNTILNYSGITWK